MINKFFTLPLILIIKFYQIVISPILGKNCRFIPTCSEYAVESLKTYGFFKGIFLTLKRISKCHPLGSNGLDPVPPKNGDKY